MTAMSTTCKSGHVYDEANTYRDDHNARQCRACNREAVSRYRLRLQAKGIARPGGGRSLKKHTVAARLRARAFVGEINARTFCSHCGAQPIEWHNPEHVLQGKHHQRISKLVYQGRSRAFIQAEIDRCTPLCRRCHMVEDGRMAVFMEQARKPKTKPKVPCIECGRMPPRRTLQRCGACYQRLRLMSPLAREQTRQRQSALYYRKTESGENLGAVQRRLATQRRRQDG